MSIQTSPPAPSNDTKSLTNNSKRKSVVDPITTTTKQSKKSEEKLLETYIEILLSVF